jgi:hypothetical protein
MKKDLKIIILALIFVFLFVFVFIFVLKNQEAEVLDNEVNIQENQAKNEILIQSEKIEVEMASEDELRDMGIVSQTPDGENMQIQVLERGPNGEIVSYRKVFKEEDIMTEIPFLRNNSLVEGGQE